jgi:hypothetical protein
VGPQACDACPAKSLTTSTGKNAITGCVCGEQISPLPGLCLLLLLLSRAPLIVLWLVCAAPGAFGPNGGPCVRIPRHLIQRLLPSADCVWVLCRVCWDRRWTAVTISLSRCPAPARACRATLPRCTTPAAPSAGECSHMSFPPLSWCWRCLDVVCVEFAALMVSFAASRPLSWRACSSFALFRCVLQRCCPSQLRPRLHGRGRLR